MGKKQFAVSNTLDTMLYDSQSGFHVRKIIILLCILLLSSVAGCGETKPFSPKKQRLYYYHPSRQLPPEPVYNRVIYARPPEVLPQVDFALRTRSRASSRPRVYMSLVKAPLEEAAKILGDSANYHHYIAPSLTKRKITFSSSGTIDRLAQEIAGQEKINVTVDHENNEVRFMPKEGAIPSRGTELSNEPLLPEK